MPPSPIPAPLPVWARWLLQLAPLISIGLQEALQYVGTMTHAADQVPDQWRRCQIVFRHSSHTDPADQLVTTMDFVNITGGKIDSTWTDADYSRVETELNSLVAGYMAFAQSQARFVETRYYRMAFNPTTDPRPFVKSGPPERVFSHSGVGGGTQAMPAQVAITTTDRTTYPRHWGRNYWPLPAGNYVDPDGTISDTAVNALANLLHTFHVNLAVNEFYPVTVVTQVEKQIVRGLLGITSVQVDDLFDVQRRRRLNKPTLKVNLGV